jgi:probable HAF family extracellular repeat protein
MKSLLVFFFILFIPLISAADNYTQLDVPTSYLFGIPELSIREGTSATAINDNSEYIGTFGQRDWVFWGVPHAFIHTLNPLDQNPSIIGDIGTDNNYKYLDFPGSGGLASALGNNITMPSGINNSGNVVGTYIDANGAYQGFEYSNNSFSLFDVPGAISTNAKSINNQGTIAGTFQDANGTYNGFVLNGGIFTEFDAPNASATYINGINDYGDMVGTVITSTGKHGFLYHNGSYSLIDYSNSSHTEANGINNNGVIVGDYTDSMGNHGFAEQGLSFTSIDKLGALNTYANGINNSGEIIGTYFDGSDHGYLTSITSITSITPVPVPAAVWLFSSALAVFGLFGRKSA